MRKDNKEWQKGWTQLCLKYRQWEDMRAKGKMKMKKKTNKDGKQYYDFDFSRYQYYYSYPDDHIGLAPPAVQREFINHIVEKSTENFSGIYVDREPTSWRNLENLLKPLELHEFLADMNQELNQKITCLRIEKTLRIKQMKGLYGAQNQLEKSRIDFIETEIRSLLHKQIRLDDRFVQLGQPLCSRLRDHKSILKTRMIDELQFSNISKGDFIVLMRLREVKQVLSFNCHVLNAIITSLFRRSQTRLHCKAIQQRAQKIAVLRTQSESQRHRLNQLLIHHLNQKEPTHFDNPDNKSKLQSLIASLNYVQSFQNNVQQTKSARMYSGHFVSTQLNYTEPCYVPLNQEEVKSRLLRKLDYYFSRRLVEEEIAKTSDEHICYKVNNLCFLQLKVLWQTYNYAHHKQESALIKIRSMMRKELELVFSHNVNSLLNIRDHSIKVPTSERWIPKLLHAYTPQTEKQSIMMYQIAMGNRFRDPTICSLVELLGVNKDAVVREQVGKYVLKSMQVATTLYEYRSLYYRNCSGDEKIHLINVLNQNISIMKSGQDSLTQCYYKSLQQLTSLPKTDSNMLTSYYMVLFLRCSETKYQLLQILNAQLMCLIKVQSRLKLLWRKGKIPFEMSKQFIDRFIDPIDSSAEGFNFLNCEVSEQHVDSFFKEMYNQDAERDFIQWKAGIGIEVRRRKSDNPLLQGKSVIYDQVYQHMEQCMTKIQFLCSESIKRRQIYLPEAKLTEIVDRFELLFEHLALQHKFQQAKLKILQLYHEQVLRLVNPEGIQLIYKQMSNLVNYNYIVDLTQPHFSQCYHMETTTLTHKSHILSTLLRKQQEYQKQYVKHAFLDYKINNLGNSIPQLSSVYYTEEITVQEHSIIEQDVEDQNQSISDTESEMVPGKNTISEISSIVDGGHFHLKTSFQEVLAKNSVQGIKEGNNKKQEIMNKKKQRIINDSILGAMLPRSGGEEWPGSSQLLLYSYSYFVVQVMRHIDHTVRKCQFYPMNHVKALFLQQLAAVVQNYSFEDYKSLIRPQELSVCLNSAHKSLNKFVEKVKNQGSISSRSSNEHWLCLGSKIMENIISGETGEEIDEMRGLYIGLNAFQLNQMNFTNKQLQSVEKSPYSQCLLMQKLITQYSAHRLDPKQWQPFQSIPYYQKRQLALFKLREQIRQTGEHSFLPCGNYNSYMKAIFCYDFAQHNYLSAVNSMLAQMLKELWALELEIGIMEKYQCCYQQFQTLSAIPGIDNRVYLRKKLDFISAYKKAAIPKQIVMQIVEGIESCTHQIPKFRKVQAKMSLNSMANQSQEFQKYVHEILRSSVAINMVGQQLHSQIRTHAEVYALAGVCSTMPLVDKHLAIVRLPNVALLSVFSEFKALLEEKEKEGKAKREIRLLLGQESLSIKRILDHGVGANTIIADWIKQQCMRRKKDQLNGDTKKIQFSKYLHRHFSTTHAQIQSKLQQKLATQLKDTQKYLKIVALRQWLQAQMLIFGCSLTPEQLIKYRKMLCNSTVIFPIFWQDNTKHIISSRELGKLKNNSLEAQEVVNAYKKEYFTYLHLKKVYRTFIQDLAEYEFQHELSDAFLILYVAAAQYFRAAPRCDQFLTKFCSPFLQQPVTQLDQFCNYVKNSTQYLNNEKTRLVKLGTSPSSFYSMNRLKYQIWNSEAKQTIKRVDSARRFIKQRLNQTKSLATRQIGDQVAMPYYRSQRLLEFVQYLGINIGDYKIQQEIFKENFDKHVHEGMVLLNAKQNFIFHMTQKSNQQKGEFLKSKDQVINIIISNQFYIKLIRQKFFSFCSNILQNELGLRRILQEDFCNQQLSRDQRILKQTINKILVPKVKLNPFLGSPLRVENYFFAGTVKMSFIDQFLNKLRNRAVLVELAEGGTGYLLKVNELDESVDVLCKAILGFSQKQFADRFRTIYESLQQIKERNAKLTDENSNLKAILKVLKGYQSKQIKSLLYEKLNDYLVAFYQHDKTYGVLVNLLRSVENKIEYELNNKFIDKIKTLEFDNRHLKEQLGKINLQNEQIIKSSTIQIRDTLYMSFKQKAESILNKKFLTELDQTETFENIESYDSHVLLKKLKMQKSFYEIKVARLQSNFNEKIKNLQKKLMEQSKLQNLLIMEQEKNRSLIKQVKELQKCSIQNQLLKKQMIKKDQQETMQKFRLIKINESLKGKIKRIEGQIQQDRSSLNTKLEKIYNQGQRNSTSVSIQVSLLDTHKIKKRSFHVKTETSIIPNSYEINLWKQKCIKSEKRLQEMILNVRKAYEHFNFTKNGAKLNQNLKIILSNYQTRKIE